MPLPEPEESITDQVNVPEDDSSDEEEEDENDFIGFPSAPLIPREQRVLEHISLNMMMTAAVISERVTDPRLGIDQQPSVFEFSEIDPEPRNKEPKNRTEAETTENDLEADENVPPTVDKTVVENNTETTPDFEGFVLGNDLPSLGLGEVQDDPEVSLYDFEGFGLSDEILRDLLSYNSSRMVPSFVSIDDSEGSDIYESVWGSHGFYIDDEIYTDQ